MKSQDTPGTSVKKKNLETDPGGKLLMVFLAMLVSSGVWLASASFAQEAKPAVSEPPKVEAAPRQRR